MMQRSQSLQYSRGANINIPLATTAYITRELTMSFTALTVKVFAVSWIYCMLVVGSPIVNILNGTLEGSIMKSASGREFIAFRGIPYALPPLGELRFQPPKPATAWSGIRSAKQDAEQCTQRDFYMNKGKVVGSEDCLYINVYTPRLPNSENRNIQMNYPVMVWFHGGGWHSGSGYSKLYSPGYLLDHDIVLVTMNYRLGPLGFLSTEDLASPGNAAMKDQVQSLRWVQENIAKFGGDPNSVTIFGESAGAVSVHYHIISPVSKGLFHRAISQSGTVHCSWTLARPGVAKKEAMRLGELMNCPTASSEELVACLRMKDAADIIGTDEKFKKYGMDPMITFKPVIEPDHPDAFLTEDPSECLKSGKVNDVPWLTGINSHEGSLRIMRLFSSDEENLFPIINENWTDFAPVSFHYEDIHSKNTQDRISNEIRKFYVGDKKIDSSLKNELIDMYSDAWFNIGAHQSVKTHLQTLSSPVYYYHFSYQGRYSISKFFSYFEDYGVSHADDLLYFFPIGVKFFFDLIELPRSTEDENVIRMMTKMWYNFAKTGNPTPEVTEDLPFKWMPVTTDNLEYLEIGNSTHLQMLKNLNNKRNAFWDSISHDGKIVQLYDHVKDEL